MTKTKLTRRVLAALLVLCLCIPFASLSVSASTKTSAWPRGEVTDRVHSHYENIPVSISGGGKRITDCYLINETTYAPLRSFCEALCPAGYEITFDAKTRVATVVADGLYLTARDGAHYITANGRYLYTDTPVVILDDGRTYVPIRLLSRALGVSVGWNAGTRSVTLDGAYAPILSGDKYYDADKLYWLSRIISAESQGEPLLGQIAVGNVVLNRTRSKDYPNSIYGVIFDRRWGVQFSPVANGTIYRQPYYLSVVAAKLCLEGVTVSEEVLFFFDPPLSTSFWIAQNRVYAFTIGSHQFYK